MRVHLVDGTFELFRCFFGAPPKKNASGLEVGAVRGLCSTLLSLLQQEDVTHVAIAFDTVIESFRNELFADYKTGAGIDPALAAQFPLAEEAAAALGLIVWPMVEFECDDALATAAARAAQDVRVEQVVICSPDKDLAQCVQGDRVVVLDRIRKKQLDEAGVIEKFGVGPALIPDLLALIGDTADGVPGLSGFGEKTASALLRRYGGIEHIPDDGWDIPVRGAARLQEVLRTQRAELALYKRLTTLRLDVPQKEDVNALAWRGPKDDDAVARVAVQCADPGLPARVRQVLEKKAPLAERGALARAP